MSEQPVARIDIHLQELMPFFFENLRSDLDILREALTGGDYQTLRNVSHGVKGAAVGYGFQDLGKLGAQVEQAAISEDPADVIAPQLDAIAAYLDTVRIVFEDTGEF